MVSSGDCKSPASGCVGSIPISPKNNAKNVPIFYKIGCFYIPRFYAVLAQLVEHVICNLGVVGSIPTGSSRQMLFLYFRYLCCGFESHHLARVQDVAQLGEQSFYNTPFICCSRIAVDCAGFVIRRCKSPREFESLLQLIF